MHDVHIIHQKASSSSYHHHHHDDHHHHHHHHHDDHHHHYVTYLHQHQKLPEVIVALTPYEVCER